MSETIRVRRVPIATTTTVVYTAWKPTHFLGSEYGSLSSDDDGRWFGRVGTMRCPESLLKGLDAEERTRAVKSWYELEYNLAYRAILTAHPELKNAIYRLDMGEVVVTKPTCDLEPSSYVDIEVKL